MKTFWKYSFRAIKDSLSRFLSMIGIVFLTTAVITGLLVTTPNMQKSMTAEFNNNNLMDFNLISSYGFDNDSIEILKPHFKNLEALNIYENKEILINESNSANSLLYEIDFNNQKINKLTLLEGNLPSNDFEIVIERNKSNYKINDMVKIDENVYKISGIVKNSMYFLKESERSIETGQIFDLIIYKNLNNKGIFTNILLTFDKPSTLNQFTNKYINMIDENKKLIDELSSELIDSRYENLGGVIDKNFIEIYTFDRNHNASFQTYKQFLNKVFTITQIFPVFFLLVSILVVLTTMTRMIEEDRQEIGITRSLGYDKINIYGKYILYALLVLLIGVGLGYATGFRLIPTIINEAFSNTFYIIPLNLEIFSLSNIIYILVIVLSITLTAIVTIGKTLKNNCSKLLLPKPPKFGKRIFLERITFIWRKLKFKYKSTIRNLFRYPRNVIMTVLGIAGSLALIYAGLGLRNSLSAITNKQFEIIYKYDFDFKTINEPSNEIKDILNEKYKSHLILKEFQTILTNIKNDENFYVTVVITNESLNEFIRLKERNNKKEIELNNEGVIITEQIAKYLKLEINDKFAINNFENINVTGITENYINNYIYMTNDYFNNNFNNINTSYKVIARNNNKTKEEIINDFSNKDQSLNINFLSDEQKNNKELLNQVSILSLVLVFAAGFLSVIIIYNLTNVSISERDKELSTLKVLGYKNKEVSNYIFREINIMTVFGIILGIPIGYGLNYYIIVNVDAPNLMMGRSIHYSTYIISVVLIIIFVFIVELIMNNKIKKINMISALKEL